LVQPGKPFINKATIVRRVLVALTSLFAGGCAGQGSASVESSSVGQSGGILAAMRPKASPEMIEKIREQERAAAAMQNANGQSNGPMVAMNGLATRVLPKVSTDPIAPPAEESQQSDPPAPPVDTSQNSSQAIAPSNPAPPSMSPSATTYNASYSTVPTPPPGALAGGLVPPPPAVTLTTQAQTIAGMPDPNNPYMNPYGNPYGYPPYPAYMNPYGMAYPPPQQQQVPAQRPSGLFGNGNKSASSDSDDDVSSKREKADFVPITPTGMEARSAYKQRDDLKVLWKGLLSSNSFSGVDPKTIAQLNKLDVGLPSESTKGNFSISQRQVDTIFKSNLAGVDRRIVPQVRKAQSDLVQSYSRYLYTYNKFALAQQSLTARKQEAEVASSNAEQQRAAADLAQAQTELDSAKDDMHSAQIELAQASSPAAARAVIAKVSGVAPGIETLVATDQNSGAAARRNMMGNFMGSVESIFTLGRVHPEEKQSRKGGNTTSGENDLAEGSDQSGTSPKDEQPHNKTNGREARKKEKEKRADKAAGAKVKVAEEVKDKDLSPAPSESASETTTAKIDSPPAVTPAPASPSSVVFTLKGVNVTARKSILTVAIKNSGAEAFTFNPDVISVADGNHKLPDAAMRADFDSTLVEPNSEVKGTITIYGRPWNDRLTVSLSESGHAIQMRR
jgi:hypothetical protein